MVADRNAQPKRSTAFAGVQGSRGNASAQTFSSRSPIRHHGKRGRCMALRPAGAKAGNFQLVQAPRLHPLHRREVDRRENLRGRDSERGEVNTAVAE